jgi:SpoVK/Ycf46/Vps4 family AAA+-type ATPase
MIARESEILTNICQELSEDSEFKSALDTFLGNGNEVQENVYLANHLMIQDLIKAYNLLEKDGNKKAKFTLAYFFEKLQGNDLGKGISIERLNKLADEKAFEENIEKIKNASFITLPAQYAKEFILTSILSRLNHPLLDKSANAIYHFSSIIAKADQQISEEEKAILKGILARLKNPQKKIAGVGISQVDDNDSLEKVLKELNELVGLENVKKAINDLTNFLKIQRIRVEKGLKANENSLHAVFTGPPGTGKTTVARLLARIYKHLSYLSSGHLVETDRSGLVAGYVGQTAIKVGEIVEQAKGGLLFIDEAYSLAQNDGGRDFGKEAIETLLKKMEDLRDDFVVVAAGYPEPMKVLINSNPGLRSRFSRYFEFEHFLPTQLMDIFKLYCKKSDFKLVPNSEDKLMEIFERLYEKRDDGFGNARVVRNIFEKITERQANRLINIQDLTKEILMNIEEEDVPEVLKTVEEVFSMKNDTMK